MKTLNFLDITSAYLVELNTDGMVRTTGSFGAFSSFEQNLKDISVGLKVPVTDTLRRNRVTLVNSLPDWSTSFPLMSEATIDKDARSYVSFPIRRYGAPIGAIGFFSTAVLLPDRELYELLLTVGNLIAYHFNSQASGKFLKLISDDAKGESAPLTGRQKRILALVSEGKTNAAIANILGFSESTIRQEVVRTLVALRVGGRSAAVKMYLERPQNFQ